MISGTAQCDVSKVFGKKTGTRVLSGTKGSHRPISFERTYTSRRTRDRFRITHGSCKVAFRRNLRSQLKCNFLFFLF